MSEKEHVIIGTAGHIDHGKTALVTLLTGKNTDRLREERERGISIELGYAELDLPSGRRLSVVDVPGHERFVRTMVAGATGIDLFLLVVAADDGVMPQTVEHLAVIELLGVTDGVVALTKADLVDDELLELVRAEAQAGRCVLYTTHYMEEAESLCDRVAIIDHGRLIAQGTLPELRGLLGERDVLRLSGVFPAERVRVALRQAGGIEIVQADESLLILALASASARLPQIFSTLASAGAEIRETTLSQPSLESLFIKLTGKELRE